MNLELASARAEARLMIQARAHALLKAKELELRTAKEDAQAEHAAELAIAQQELAAVSRDLSQARSASYACICLDADDVPVVDLVNEELL